MAFLSAISGKKDDKVDKEKEKEAQAAKEKEAQAAKEKEAKAAKEKEAQEAKIKKEVQVSGDGESKTENKTKSKTNSKTSTGGGQGIKKAMPVYHVEISALELGEAIMNSRLNVTGESSMKKFLTRNSKGHVKKLQIAELEYLSLVIRQLSGDRT